MGSDEEAAGTGEMDAAQGLNASPDPYGSMFGSGLGGPKDTPSTSDPTYDGKTYTQWLKELQTERKPERLTEAIRAFASLGEDDEELATRSALVIMKIMRRNGSYEIDDSPQGKLVAQAHDVLLQLPGEITVSAVENELREGNTRSRSFVNSLLNTAIYGWGSPNVDFTAAVERRREPLYQLLLALPDDEAAVIRARALTMVVDHVQSKGVELDEIEGLIPRLQAALKDKDLQLVAVGANSLVELDPENEYLFPALMRLVSSNKYEDRVDAVRSLGHLGARSQPAIDRLLSIIRPLVEPDSKSPVNPQAYAGFGGGGAMSEMGGGAAGGYGAGFGGYYNKHQDINYVTIETLGKIGPTAKSALPLLRKIVGKKPSVESPEGGGALGEDYGTEGGYGMSGGGPSYVAVARTAINRIEGKEPIDAPSEEDDKSPSATRGGGFF
jgi:hypothetical protein